MNRCELFKRLAVAVVATVALGSGLLGCEWDSSGDGYNSRYNFVNFSGVYRGYNGGLLVTDYSSQLTVGENGVPGSGIPGTPGSTSVVEKTVNGERIATGNGISTKFSGNLDHDPVVLGSLSISAPSVLLTDPNGTGTLNDGGNQASGKINYSSGQWSIDYQGAPSDGAEMFASYKYTVNVITPPKPGTTNEATSGTTPTGSGENGYATSGSSGADIYSFTVEQYGNDLRIVDNNGKEYKGKLGDVRSTSGVNQDSTAVSVAAGDTFVANFEAKGVSAAGKSVTIAGTLQGLVQSTSGRSGVFDSRQMFGTWIEKNGRTGDVKGEASPITITFASTGDTTSSGNSTN